MFASHADEDFNEEVYTHADGPDGGVLVIGDPDQVAAVVVVVVRNTVCDLALAQAVGVVGVFVYNFILRIAHDAYRKQTPLAVPIVDIFVIFQQNSCIIVVKTFNLIGPVEGEAGACRHRG